MPPAGPGNGAMLTGPFAAKCTVAETCMPSSWLPGPARGLPALGCLWFSCPSGSFRLFPTSLLGSIYGDSLASYEVTGGKMTWWVCSEHDCSPVCRGERPSLEKTRIAPEWGSADKPARGLPTLRSPSTSVPGDNNRGATKTVSRGHVKPPNRAKPACLSQDISGTLEFHQRTLQGARCVSGSRDHAVLLKGPLFWEIHFCGNVSLTFRVSDLSRCSSPKP